MTTDQWFYELFRRFPDQLFRLAGLHFEGRWRMESVTVKTTEKRIDALLFRLDAPDVFVFVEFQGWSDPAIYWRLYREITTWYESRPAGESPFVAVVVFLDPGLDPGDPPLEPRPPNRFLKLCLADGLRALKEDPGPLVVFRPLVVEDLDAARREAPEWVRTLRALNLPAADVTFLIGHLADILIRRFKELSLEEVKAMIELVPLDETRAGREAFALVREEGRRIGRLQTLESLLGLPESSVEALSRLTPEALDRRIDELMRRLRSGLQ